MIIRIRDDATALTALRGICSESLNESLPIRVSANNMNGLTTSITGFIRKCYVVPTENVHCFPNENPWINTEVLN